MRVYFIFVIMSFYRWLQCVLIDLSLMPFFGQSPQDFCRDPTQSELSLSILEAYGLMAVI
jgi:hypothetical protein